MENYIPFLKDCPIFEEIDKPDLLRMLNCLDATVKNYDKKSTVFLEGDPATHIGVLLSGSAQMLQTDYYGNRSIISEINPPESFSEAFACAKVGEMPVSVITNEPSKIMFIDCQHILHTCSNNCAFHRQLIYNLMKSLAVKTVDFHQRITVTSKRTTREKLIAYLTQQSKKAKNNEFYIPFDRQELADYLEVERSGLSLEISKLKNEGIIDSKKNYFKLL